MNDKITIFPGWWVWIERKDAVRRPYEKWAGQFESKQAADEWIAKQPMHGLRAGQSAIIWEEHKPNNLP